MHRTFNTQIRPIFQRIFETSISQHWDNLLADYYYQVYQRIIDESGKCGDGLHNYWSPTDMDIQGAYPYYYNPVHNPTASVNFLKIF
ncbi:unnamed protein product [Oppiella nova]|uniref:Uncharacterized protein n=1 Tax=Oppiella nova TaxID=334625 RepID=A0A7R9M6V6_9ACAR|nr:unnamed protein product [Oppiella nova]CAG2170582.1 unnamed protein product [Oppiella nova]